MIFDILSLFPEYFTTPFNVSMIKRAIERGLVKINLVDIRSFSKNRHQKADDRPFGGGPGMVMMPQPTLDAIRAHKGEDGRVIYLSPQGSKLNAKKCEELSKYSHLVLLCGHYEGVDERVMKEVDEEISIGDYVLTNGCVAAIVLLDATIRFLPGVLGDELSALEDSFQADGLLDTPHYTHPVEFEGERVPDVLLSGNHALIDKWRCRMKVDKTKRIRPDLYEQYITKLRRKV